MIVYLNGSYVDAAAASVPLFDGGYLYGDGLYETLRLYDGRPFDLEGHLARLRRELELFAFEWRPDLDLIRAVLAELAVRNGLTAGDARARLTISRGGAPENPLPLADLAQLPTTVSAWLQPLPAELAAWQRDGIGIRVARSPFARGNFPQLKTLNTLPAVMALRFAHAEGAQEAILVDRHGKLLEGSTSNLFLVREGSLFTPPARLGLLAGRTRTLVMALAERRGLACHEEACERRDLLTADEVFVCGSVKEIVPAVRADGQAIGDGRPGPVTQALQTEYRQAVRDSLAGHPLPQTPASGAE